MRRIVYLMISLIFSEATYAVNNYEIKGVVRDAENNTPLAGASVRLSNLEKGTLTDEKGTFSLGIPKQHAGLHLVVSYAGYRDDTLKLSPTAKFYTIRLKPASALLDDVVISTGGRILTRESPTPITLVSSKKIDQTLQSNIIDVLVKSVPGLSAVKTGPNISKPFIRGLGYNRVLTLYDGIRQEGQQWGDEHGIEIDPYGLEKAEVIKGPVSLIYGSDALAGVVSMFPFIPKGPNAGIHGRLTSEYQHNNGLFGNGLRIYSRSQNWYGVTSGSYRMAKNYQNAVDGRVYNTNFREASASFSLGHVSASGKSSIGFTLFNDLQGIPDGSRDSITRKFTKQIYEGEKDAIKSRPAVSTHELNSYTLSLMSQHIQHYRLYTNNHYKSGTVQIDASLAWQQNIRQEFSHPTKPTQAGMYVRLNTTNYGLKFTLPASRQIDLTIGTNGMNQKNKNKDATDFPIPDYQLWDIGNFVFAKWKYNHFTVSGGIRYDHRNIKGDPLYTTVDKNTGFTERAAASTPNSGLHFEAFNKNYSGLSMSLGGTYEINPHLSVKANIARGYRAPNITELASNGLDPGAHIIYIGNMSSVPEFSFQQDLGIELFFKDLSGSLSFFNNHISHYSYLTEVLDGDTPITDPQGNKTFQYQQASAHLYGLELSASIHPASWKGLSWNNSLALTYGTNTNAIYKDKGTMGRYLPFIPPATWLSNVTETLTLSNKIFTTLKFTAELEHKAPQNRYLGLFDTETATPAYTLINLTAGTSIRYSRHQLLKFQVGVNNIGNVVYQSNMSRLKYFEYYDSSPTDRYGIFGMGRNICVKLILPF